MEIAIYDLEGHFLEIIEGENIRGISDKLNLSSELYHCLKGSSNYSGSKQYREVINGKHLKKIGDISNCLVGVKHKYIHKSYKGNYICTYRNTYQASIKTNINESSIHRCLKGVANHAGGFGWEYAN